jgi:TolA-binding protein
MRKDQIKGMIGRVDEMEGKLFDHMTMQAQKQAQREQAK